MHAVIEIRSSYYTLGSVLGIRYGDMAAIKHDNPQDAKQALYWVLVKWLSQDEKHGSPTWRKLVEAVDNEAGGNNHALAKRIAKQHPTGRSTVTRMLGIFVLLLYSSVKVGGWIKYCTCQHFRFT